MNCFNCQNLMTDFAWQVKFVDEEGALNFKKCCSEDCCSAIVNKFSYIHRTRLDDTIHQSFQKTTVDGSDSDEQLGSESAVVKLLFSYLDKKQAEIDSRDIVGFDEEAEEDSIARNAESYLVDQIAYELRNLLNEKGLMKSNMLE